MSIDAEALTGYLRNVLLLGKGLHSYITIERLPHRELSSSKLRRAFGKLWSLLSSYVRVDNIEVSICSAGRSRISLSRYHAPCLRYIPLLDQAIGSLRLCSRPWFRLWILSFSF